MECKPLGAFGVEVTDLDFASDLTPETARAVVDAVVENHVAVFRGQHLDKADYDRFGRLFGDPIDFFFTPDLDPEFPALIRISNSPDLDPGRRDGASFWHTDGSYEHFPASFTMLYGLEAPDKGGETLFADLTAAYEALPEATKARIEGLQLKHMLVGGKRGPDETPLKLDPDEPGRDGGVRARKRAAEQPLHPVVLTHPVTGRRSLYAIAGTPFGIEGMGDEEAQALLDELKAHATQERFIIRVKAGVGDILIWDNQCTVHRATPLEYSAEPGKRRALLRISTNGLPPSYAATRTPAFQRRTDIEVVRFA
jgi:taurine dioxygenase